MLRTQALHYLENQTSYCREIFEIARDLCPSLSIPSASFFHLHLTACRFQFLVQLQVQEVGALCSLGCTAIQRKSCKRVESEGSLDCSKCWVSVQHLYKEHLPDSSKARLSKNQSRGGSCLSPAGTRPDTRYL